MSILRLGRGVFAAAKPSLLAPIAFTGALMSPPLHGQILLGSGDDEYTLTNQHSASRQGGTLIDGGAGFDTLRLRAVTLDNPSRLQHWENLYLEQGTQLTLDTSLVLGDSGGHPGHLQVDSSSALLLPYFSAALTPYNGQNVTLTNHGVIDMRGNTANRLSIHGDYRGHGTIHMDFVAEGDASLADRVILHGGHASGHTRLLFNRLAGHGADTEKGILVVEARDGASTSHSAFYMDGSVSAGPYEYFLFRGATSPQDANNWYLRSTILPGDAVATPQPAQRPYSSLSSASSTGIVMGSVASQSSSSINTRAALSGNTPVPIYRPEIPLYAQAKSLARLTSLQEIGSYHKRRGEQRSWFDGVNDDWIRVHHMRADYGWSGDVDNRFDGDITGVQLGTNLWAAPTCTGGAREMGLFAGSTRASGDVTGFARGFTDYSAGHNQLTSHHIGYYFNDYRPDMGYFDFTAKVAHLKLESESSRGIGDTISGLQLTLSVEKGFTWQVGEAFNLEPQLQAVVNYSNLSAYQDGISKVEPDMTPEANFRAGLRGYNLDSQWLDGNLRVYLFGNLWHTLGGNDELLFDLDIRTNLDRQATWGEFGGGIVLLESQYGSAFMNIGYQRSLDNLDWSGANANLGFNWAW
ncbi:autotransporter outer membrane beta-barrel domain-containing protein [Microbulbifer elongatus]|uniref:Autotransporter outer membrane beta-barrel domain-containing protein n=1 Tax=Microbulbifer elongatus TaxID=86173 RepID=A0ABT1P103_9GAMM|nr:autotransporter outer membrane beta-barrel domain-containing protein [Microbulbifer elongatus]MCQ3828659.1 autotransporter outer membrane beta-barrel domain-containing protein [Microbulbifer elongatus]